jgi:hypothetical protein
MVMRRHPDYFWRQMAISMAPPIQVERIAQVATATVAVRFLRSARWELLAPFIAFAMKQIVRWEISHRLD